MAASVEGYPRSEVGGRKVGFLALSVMLVIAPLHWGGNVPLALLLLELAALGLLAYVCWRPDFRSHMSRPLLAALGGLLLIPLLQLVPLPAALWNELPGRNDYAQALKEIDGIASLTGLRAVSLIPFQTESAWLALLPPVAVFLVAVGLRTRQLQTLVVVFIGIAAFQAILGLIQYGDGPGSVFYLGNPYMRYSATGTYVNRSHLAGLLEMALPLGLSLLAATIGRSRGHRSHGLRRRLAGLGSLQANQAFLYGAVALAILLGLIFTRSRAGISLGILGILLCTLVFSRRLGGSNVYGLIGTFTAIGLGLAIMIGLVPVLQSFAYKDPLSDTRWPIFSNVLQAIGHFFPLGSGAGTFMEVFHRFHPADVVTDKIIDHAHNDYLEWTMEGGGMVVVLLLVLLGLYLRQWPRVWSRQRSWSTFRFVQAGAGIALLLMLLHSVVDFNLHIPANAIFFAFLAAVFFHRLGNDEAREPPSSARLRGDDIIKKAQSPPRTIPPENTINPFDVP